MKFSDVKELTGAELRKRIHSIRGDIFESRMKHSLGQLSSPLDIRHKRKDMARLMTALQMKLGKKKQ